MTQNDTGLNTRQREMLSILRAKRIESELKKLEPKLEELMKEGTELASFFDEIDKEVGE